MITKYVHRNITWVDLESPDENEVREVAKEYGINPIVAEELRLPTRKSRVDLYTNCIFLALHFPVAAHTGERMHREAGNQELDFVIGKHFIITTRYETLDPLHRFSKIFEVKSALDKSDIGEHAGFVFYYMIEKLYESLGDELEAVRDEITKIEENIFRGRETEMVIHLSKLTRTLLDFKRALALHREVLQSFEIAGKKFFGEEFVHKLRSVIGEYYRISEMIEADLALATELRDTNNSLVSTKQSQIMKTLTMMAFITFPLSLIATIFGMNTKIMPLVGLRNDFWIIIGIMAALILAFLLFFKHKKWL